ERFRREAEALARVSGEGVVPVHEASVDQGRLFLVMGLMENGSLRARLRAAGRIDWREAASIVAALARTLERCHRASIVHRDLKPENVLFDERGEPRLADFGAVRDLGAASLTATGTLIGTPSYMSPELLNGAKATASDDIYALGVILHELVAGELPFPRSSSLYGMLQERLAARRTPVHALVPGAPAALDAVIDRALQPAGTRRHLSASELARELESVLAHPPAGGSWARTGIGLVVGLALVAAAIVWVGSPGQERAPLPPPPAPLAPRPPVLPESSIDRAVAALGAGKIDEAAKLWPSALGAAVDSASRARLIDAACACARARVRGARTDYEERVRSLHEAGRALDLAWSVDADASAPAEVADLADQLKLEFKAREDHREGALVLELDCVRGRPPTTHVFETVFWDTYFWHTYSSPAQSLRILARAERALGDKPSLHYARGIVHFGSSLRPPTSDGACERAIAELRRVMAMERGGIGLRAAILCAWIEKKLGRRADLRARVVELTGSSEQVLEGEAKNLLRELEMYGERYGAKSDRLYLEMVASATAFLGG
ncbi:MAG TPA: serine/threonine-protein kinase, partial [Planctomycetota bacterium]|nr:serine/threonine-protein kinase [Planctomycetota bacterium]